MARIFISYRRDDAMGYSLLVFDRLSRYFGRGNIFMDVDAIPPGVDFKQVIEREVGASSALVALIGRHWLTLADPLGQQRITLPDDFVRQEIAIALQRGIPVIPVLLRGARMPALAELPEALHPLARRQAIALSDERIDYDLNRLVKALVQVTAETSWLDAIAVPPAPLRDSHTAATIPSRSQLATLRTTRLLFEPEVVRVPGGTFFSGDESREVVVPHFWIAKYPAKVGEYRAFVEMGGYQDRRYWTAAGWAWKEARDRQKPDYWDESQWTENEWLPVIGVSWYEATAYCRWLSTRAGAIYRLPGTLEWEKAARGTDGRVYPWGNERRQAVCNIYSAGIGQTSQVGHFSPAGDSPYGVADLIGNVAEWCASRWTTRADTPPDDNPEGEFPRVQHGGSWCSTTPQRAAMRMRGSPDFASNYVGFRVARSND